MLFIIISLICGLMIIISDGQKRFNWCICAMLLISQNIILIQKPQLPVHRFFLLCFWLSVIFRKEYKGKKFPLIVPLVIYFIGFYLIGYNAEALEPFSKFWKPTSAIIESYLVLLLAYYGTEKVTVNSKPIINTLYLVMFYGIFTLITKWNPYQDMIHISPDEAWLNDYYFSDRIRITSTWSHPIAYGFICSLFFYAFLPYYKKKKIKILLSLLAFNILICGSRTDLAAFILMGAIYIPMRFKASKAIVVGSVTLIVVSITYLAVPFIQDKIDTLIGTVDGKDQTGGSSTEMREDQLAASLYIFNKSPIFGEGPDYVQEQIMPDQDFYSKEGLNFYGFESYGYIIFIERGIIGIVIELIMFLSIISYALNQRRKYKEECSTILSISFGFVFFSLSTGVLGTFTMAMMFIGITMSRINNTTCIKKRLLEKS